MFFILYTKDLKCETAGQVFAIAATCEALCWLSRAQFLLKKLVKQAFLISEPIGTHLRLIFFILGVKICLKRQKNILGQQAAGAQSVLWRHAYLKACTSVCIDVCGQTYHQTGSAPWWPGSSFTSCLPTAIDHRWEGRNSCQDVKEGQQQVDKVNEGNKKSASDLIKAGQRQHQHRHRRRHRHRTTWGSVPDGKECFFKCTWKASKVSCDTFLSRVRVSTFAEVGVI